MYKMLRNVDSTRCNNIISLEINSNVTRINLMSTQISSTRAKLNQTDSERHDEIDLKNLWYKRMGHIGEKGIQAMKRKYMVKGFPECGLEVEFCEHCIYGKKIQVSFSSGEIRENGIL